MKKSDIGLFFALIVCACVSFFSLLHYFDKNLTDTIESLLETIFTGSIIALPSTIIVLYNSHKDNLHELHLMLARVSIIVDSSSIRFAKYKDDNNANSFFDSNLTENEREELTNLYRLIAEKTGKLRFKKRMDVVAIQEDIDEYSRILSENNISIEDKIQNINSTLSSLKFSLEQILKHI